MVRHAIFVLVLVGAAFAGGAAINGPGLAWVQRNFIGGPTIIVDGSAPGEAPRPAKRFPSASLLPLQVDFSSRPAALPTPAAPAQSPAPAPAPIAATAPNTPPLGFPLDSPIAPAAAARPAPAATPPGDLPPLDLPPDPVVASPPAPATAPAPAKADPVARLASAGGLEPAPAGPGRDWAEARRRLKALGVSRYTIDAEAGGRVRFSCVIPVDGLRAVGHHFEAEGDDEFQAIDATIRRVALWKATEPGRTEP